MPTLKVIITSTREGRAGVPVATWFAEHATRHGKFTVETVNLQAVNLPLFDEPTHPMKRQYQHEHTRRWSQIVAGADAFVFVVPEYNFGMPPALLNALDFLYHEWSYKPAAFVSYGGASGGCRSVQMAKQMLIGFKVMPIPEGVALPYFAKQIQDGVFTPADTVPPAATRLLDELHRWSNALATLRVQAS